MQEGMRKWLMVRVYQIHKFHDVGGWDRPHSKAAGDGNVVLRVRVDGAGISIYNPSELTHSSGVRTFHAHS